MIHFTPKVLKPQILKRKDSNQRAIVLYNSSGIPSITKRESIKRN